MKRKHRYQSTLPYLVVAIASVLFAVAQPNYTLAPEANAFALADISWDDASPAR